MKNFFPTLLICLIIAKCANSQTCPCQSATQATDCDDGNLCTRDTCSDCQCHHTQIILFCENSVCSLGACNPATGQCGSIPFPPSISCTNDPCFPAECDGLGHCVSLAPIVCDDGPACAVGQCDSTTGLCTYDHSGCTPSPSTSHQPSEDESSSSSHGSSGQRRRRHNNGHRRNNRGGRRH